MTSQRPISSEVGRFLALILGMTNTQDWADKVDRAATDPERIERRRGITPALTVPRHSLEDVAAEFGVDLDALRDEERTITYLSAETLAEMEASETKVPESHAIRAKELRARFLRP